MNKQGLIPIWIRITVDGKRAECSTQKQIHPKFWDAENNKVIDKFSEARSINDYLTLVKADLLRHYNILLSTKDTVTAEFVKNNYKGVKEMSSISMSSIVSCFKDNAPGISLLVLNRNGRRYSTKGSLRKFQKPSCSRKRHWFEITPLIFFMIFLSSFFWRYDLRPVEVLKPFIKNIWQRLSDDHEHEHDFIAPIIVELISAISIISFRLLISLLRYRQSFYFSKLSANCKQS